MNLILTTLTLKNKQELIDKCLYIDIKDLWAPSIPLWKHFLYAFGIFLPFQIMVILFIYLVLKALFIKARFIL